MFGQSVNDAHLVVKLLIAKAQDSHLGYMYRSLTARSQEHTMQIYNPREIKKTHEPGLG